MRDLKYYTCIYDSDEIELFFLKKMAVVVFNEGMS